MEKEITQLIHEFLEKLSVTIDTITVEHTEIHTLYTVSTRDSAMLIGQNGETLQALTGIIRKIAERRLGEQAGSFMLDVNGYNRRKLEDFQNKIRMLAERARVFKYDVELSPMNAYERMMVHALFTNDPEIATESQGEGKMRRVVLKYTSNKPQTTNNGHPTDKKVLSNLG